MALMWHSLFISGIRKAKMAAARAKLVRENFTLVIDTIETKYKQRIGLV